MAPIALVKAIATLQRREPPSFEPASTLVRLYHRLKASKGIAATATGLVLAYLGVAVTAHWFPFRTTTPVLAEQIFEPPGPHRIENPTNSGTNSLTPDMWEHQVLRVTGFINKHQGEVVKLELDIEPVAGRYVTVTEAPEGNLGIDRIELSSGCDRPDRVCYMVEMSFIDGPAANLGYDYVGSVRASVFGYYRIGRTFNGTGTILVHLIPVDAPQ